MIKKGDFIKLNYTGRLDDGTVFDTTVPAVAKQSGLEGTRELAPVTICVGQGMILAGIDHALIGRSPGSFSIALEPEQAFGKKDPALMRIIPTQQLRKQRIEPHVGLRLNIDGNYGVVRSTGGGRTVVDFNHPLASQQVTYDVEVLELVADPQQQVEAIMGHSGLPYQRVMVEGGKATIAFRQLLPQPLLDVLNKRIQELTSIKTVSFEAGNPPKA